LKLLSFKMKIPSRLKVPLAVIAYSFCSGTLVLVNKLILSLLPYPSLLISVQLLAAISFIYTAKACRCLEVDEIQWKYVKPYLIYTIAFSLGVYCNMKSLSISNVETVIVFRALAPTVVSVLDFIFLGRELPSTRSIVGLSLIVTGVYGYAQTDQKFLHDGFAAYFWPTIYLIIISFEMTYGKKITSTVDLKTQSGPVLYTNLLAFLPSILFAYAGGEFEQFHFDLTTRENIDLLPNESIPLLLIGCIIGTGIGYSSWYCREKVSATTFTLIGVMNKCLTVILNFFIWDKHASPVGITFLLLCLFGGSIYRQAPLRSKEKEVIPNHHDFLQKVVGREDTLEEQSEIDHDTESFIELTNELVKRHSSYS